MPLDDAELIARARRQEATAWEMLMRQHQQAVFRLAYLLLGDADDAADVAQDAFIRAHAALDRFDASRPLRPWLLRIAANLARNRRRSAGRYWAALLRMARLNPDWAAPARRADAVPDSPGLWRAVCRLSAADQQVIYLRYFMEMSEAETAGALGVAPGTVKSRLHRALDRLRAVVEREFPELRDDVEPSA